ncbi:MAG: NrfD/PsrC family molybdoenzyme membrane anchor subunit [Bacillota bacterium]
MNELTTTNHNEMIHPFLQVWTWQIPVYLFLGGLVAGLMIISGYFLFTGKYKSAGSIASRLPVISLVLLSLGMFALFLDLEHKMYVWRVYTTFRVSSPMSWGSWILLLVYPALLANILINPPAFLSKYIPDPAELYRKEEDSQKLIRGVAIVNMGLGILVGTYTGILLSTLGARPLWNTSILWLLFLISGLSSAAALVHLISKDNNEKSMLVKADNSLLAVEIFVILMMIIGLLSSSRAHIEAVRLILSGPFAASFWVLVIGIGILIPLFLQILTLKEKVKHSAIPAILVIAGGIVLRFIIVYAGQYSSYHQ